MKKTLKKPRLSAGKKNKKNKPKLRHYLLVRKIKKSPKKIEKFKQPHIYRQARKIQKRSKKHFIPKIKVVGVGGAGGNAITRMEPFLPRGVELISINTDIQDLNHCKARKKICIGKMTTRGFGAGMNPELGRKSAEEDRDAISKAIDGADMIFLTAGFGGGTGSGALPTVAEVARELGILTVAIITKPFSFEGLQRSQIANDAISRLRDRVDSFIVIPNDRIFSIIDKNTSLNKAFLAIDEVLKNAILGIAELIISPGIINVDFADIRTIIENSGASVVGVGIGNGKNRASDAANKAINSPLLETSIDGAKGVLFSISGRKDVKMNEVNDVAKILSENIDSSGKIIFGAYYDNKIRKGQIKVIVIATGFGASFGRNYSLFGEFEPLASATNNLVRTEDKKDGLEQKNIGNNKEINLKKESDDSYDNEKQEDMWEVPAFLRKKRKRR